MCLSPVESREIGCITFGCVCVKKVPVVSIVYMVLPQYRPIKGDPVVDRCHDG